MGNTFTVEIFGDVDGVLKWTVFWGGEDMTEAYRQMADAKEKHIAVALFWREILNDVSSDAPAGV